MEHYLAQYKAASDIYIFLILWLKGTKQLQIFGTMALQWSKLFVLFLIHEIFIIYWFFSLSLSLSLKSVTLDRESIITEREQMLLEELDSLKKQLISGREKLSFDLTHSGTQTQVV